MASVQGMRRPHIDYGPKPWLQHASQPQGLMHAQLQGSLQEQCTHQSVAVLQKYDTVAPQAERPRRSAHLCYLTVRYLNLSAAAAEAAAHCVLQRSISIKRGQDTYMLTCHMQTLCQQLSAHAL